MPQAGQRVDHGLFDAADQLAHAQAQAAQVHQRIGHQLAGAVVGHLATAVDAEHRDVAGSQHVLGLAGLAQREHRIVFDQPQLVGRVGAAGVGEALHGPPHRLIGLAAELADTSRRAVGAASAEPRRSCGYSVHFTAGCSRRAPCAAS